MDLEKVGWKDVHWVHQPRERNQQRAFNMLINLPVPRKNDSAAWRSLAHRRSPRLDLNWGPAEYEVQPSNESKLTIYQ